MFIRINHLYYGILLILTLLVPAILKSQNKPAAGGKPAAQAISTTIVYTSDEMVNRIFTWEPNMATGDINFVTAPERSSAEIKQTTEFVDGLGRPLQTVSKQFTPGLKDWIVPHIYDDYGRETYQYLSYSSDENDGSFKKNPVLGQSRFFTREYPGENIFYSQTLYEQSPLNRVRKSYASGNSWASEGGDKAVVKQFAGNGADDQVCNWYILSGSDIPIFKGFFVEGALQKLVTINEQGNQTIEFIDQQNKTLLKQTVVKQGATVKRLNTYFVYDDFNNLRCVIPPKAVDAISGNWVVNNTVLAELCFVYRYDGSSRMILKKIPGADSTEMVYDKRDRLVFSRDGNLRNNKHLWLATFYDGVNRPVMTALFNNTETREALQQKMNAVSSESGSIAYTFPGTEDLVVASYDGRNAYSATKSITFTSGFETAANAAFETEINPNLNNGQATLVTNNPLPDLDVSKLTPISYAFYDNYNFPGVHPLEAGDLQELASADPYAESIKGKSALVKGLSTGGKVKVLGTDQWLTSTVYYDDKGRALQTIADNISGGKDISSARYNFNGKTVSTFVTHQNPRSSITPQTTVQTTLLYDHSGRLTRVTKRLNKAAATDRVVAENVYNESGQLKTKKLNVVNGAALDVLNYEYNIRGWLTGINKDFANGRTTAGWFGLELNYDDGFTRNQFSGNISGMKWKSKSDGIVRAYGYDYDDAGRLVDADFTQQNSAGAGWTSDQKDFSVSSVSYDANGNILSLAQKGMEGTKIVPLDNLAYTYSNNGNKLAAVYDSSKVATKLGDFKNGTNTNDDYDYDLAGNLTKDLNKNITSIVYNHLNLPEKIVIRDKGTISYLYTADGTKHRKIVEDITNVPVRTTVTDYIDGFVYEQDTLRFFGFEEGRIRPIYKPAQPPVYAYDYFEKDHLGNVRMILTDNNAVNTYAATMETEQAAKENALFSNVDNTRSNKPVGYPADQQALKNQFVATLNAKEGGNKIGPSLVLRVMAGDTIQIGAKAFYKSAAPQDRQGPPPVADMMVALVNTFGGAGSAGSQHGTSVGENTGPFNTEFYSRDYQRLKEKDPDQGRADKPKAYLNFVMFDDGFELVDENSGVKQVKSEPDQLQVLATDKITIKKNGFLYVYTSNESRQDVSFDDVVVTKADGPMLEETHYYPFGLTMQAISSNAMKGAGYPENKLKYIGKELQNDEFGEGNGLEWYDYGARMEDPQLGRWHVIDPMASKYESLSPYVYAINDPVNLLDPDGKDVYLSGNAEIYTGVDAEAAFKQILSGNRPVGGAFDPIGGNSNSNVRHAFIPAALLPLLGEMIGIYGTASSTTLFQFPGTDDWKAAWHGLKYDVATLDYELNGGPAGRVLDKLKEYFSKQNSRPATAFDPVLAQKMIDEMTGIVSKTLAKKGYVYKLEATQDGTYNVYTHGSILPTGTIQLKKGDVWKFGESTSGERYDKSFLQKEKVKIVTITTGNQQFIKLMEKILIYNYFFHYGILPPGNKMFR